MAADVHHDVTKGTKVTNFNYNDYTYSYIDENGVEKTASLTDEAVTTNQMIGLLKKVYCDPTIPGIRYAYDFYKDGEPYQRKKLDYNYNANAGTPWTKDYTSVSNPDQDGMTMLLVEVKDDYNTKMFNNAKNDVERMDLAYESMKLASNFTRVNDENNPGYIFSFDGISTNRFFFLSKGKPRATETAPLYMLYEQISPVNYSNGQATVNFIDSIKAGNSYQCFHDCKNIISLQEGHWFTIDTEGEHYSLANIAVFLPDRRFERNLNPNEGAPDASLEDVVYKNYGRPGDDTSTDYDPTIAPKVLMYTADLNAEAVPSGTVGVYQVNLDWSTSFTKDNLGVDVPQHFYVYIVEHDGSRTLIQDVEKDENGMVVVRNHSYFVEQTADPQDISYVITAHTINYYNNGDVIRNDDLTPYITISAESPVRTVTIPGHNAFFTQASEYRSRYHIVKQGQEYNIYKNKLTIQPATIEDYNVINTSEHYELTRTDADGSKVTIANVQFAPVDGTNNYNYVVSYNASTQNTTLLFDDEAPVTSGTLTGFDNSIVTVIDRFTASTQNNNHSDKYIYAFERIDGDEYNTFSNRFVVPVFKTTNAVAGEGHTLQEVKADVDHNAKATPNNEISFNAMFVKAMNLVNYEIRRLNQADFKQYTKIGKAENFNNSGEYYIYALSEEGTLDQLIEKVKVDAEGGKLTSVDINCSSSEKVSSYVPVINTLFNGYPDKPNSYGCDIKDIEYPVLKLSASDMAKTAPFAGEGGQYMAYKVGLSLTPELNSLKNVFYYRIWRVVDGKTTLINETLLNNLEDKSQPDPSGGELWGTKYYKIKDFFPGNNPINGIDDIFIDYALNGDSKNVTYIARLYATSLDKDDVPATLLASANGKDYFIAQDIITVTFNGGTPTGIDAIDSDNMVESVTYYNAMGHPSSSPHAGINIVETRYSNGTRKIEKIVK